MERTPAPRRDPIRVVAPAKLNLSLAVLARRPDGFHEIESLMVPVSLHDVLVVRPLPGPEIELVVRFAAELPPEVARDVPTDGTNLVVRAARMLAEEAGVAGGLAIELEKHVPSGAGLGGGSSDAAAVLAAAARAWGLDWPAERLADLGGRLGSDVPWFFAGGAALAAGRGERIVPVSGLPDLAAVVAWPAAGLSTGAVYAACTPEPQRRGEAAALAAALAAGGLAAARPLLHNSLEAPARRLCPDIDRLLDDLAAAGGFCPRLTGSGSACFALARSPAEAEAVAARIASLDGDRIGPRWSVRAVRLTPPAGGLDRLTA